MIYHGSLPKIIAVIGPTASGKTDLGLALASHFGGEIVSADAKQVYRRMDIGTAKELNTNIPQHLIDIKEPGEAITVAEYQGLAYEVIDELLKKEVMPVLVGGSGLYAEAVIQGYQFGGRGKKVSKPRYDCLTLGLAWERAELVARAESRLDDRISQGLIEEVQNLLDEGVDPEWLWKCGIEYRYISQYLLGNLSREEAVTKVKTAIRQFIKRQYTWWRRHDDVHWVKDYQEAEQLVKKFIS